MVAPSKHHTFSLYPSNSSYCSFPPQYTSQHHASAPTSAPPTSRTYDGIAELSPTVFGTSTTPCPHGVPLFNEDMQKRGGFNFQDGEARYQYASSPSSSSDGGGGGTYIDTHATAPPSNTPSQTPYQPQYQYHNTPSQPRHSASHLEREYYTPSTFLPQHNGNTPTTYLTTTSPSTGPPRRVEIGPYIGTPSTPPSSGYPHVSSPEVTTPTTEACARYRAAIETPLTPFYPSSSPIVPSPMSEFGGVLVGVGEGEKGGGCEFDGERAREVENKEASEEVRRLMADQEGGSRFPGSLGGWVGFEGAAAGEGEGRDELISPRTNKHSFEMQDTPLAGETSSPLAPAYSPHTSPPVRRIYSNGNAYRNFVPPPGPSSPLPPAPHLPLPEPRYSESYSLTTNDYVVRAHQLLEEHMKNRWSSVLSANSALQHITGTTGGSSSKAPLETAAATLMQMQTSAPPPQPLLSAFNTPMQSMQRMQAERAGRMRSLRAIYDEYIILPRARAEGLCSLSIHAVSGSFIGGGADSPQPAKMRNELLAHFTEAEGSTAIQFLEIDIPNPAGGYNRHPFERWAFFVIALPMVCGPGGVDRGYVGGHERASMFIAAPLREVVVDGGKAVQDVLGDGRQCLRRDFVFGPGVGGRMEVWEKYGRWVGVGERAGVGRGVEWLCAEVEGWEGRMEEWGDGGEGVLLEGVRRDVERLRRAREAMGNGVCRVVTRVVDYEGVRRAERARDRRVERERDGEGGDWEREGVRAVEGGSSVKKWRKGR